MQLKVVVFLSIFICTQFSLSRLKNYIDRIHDIRYKYLICIRVHVYVGIAIKCAYICVCVIVRNDIDICHVLFFVVLFLKKSKLQNHFFCCFLHFHFHKNNRADISVLYSHGFGRLGVGRPHILKTNFRLWLISFEGDENGNYSKWKNEEIGNARANHEMVHSTIKNRRNEPYGVRSAENRTF